MVNESHRHTFDFLFSLLGIKKEISHYERVRSKEILFSWINLEK